MFVLPKPIHVFWCSTFQVLALFLLTKINYVKSLFGIHFLFKLGVAVAQSTDPISMM